MKELFENLGIWEFDFARRSLGEVGKPTDANRMIDHPEQAELAQFGRVLHDWRPKDKQKRDKKEDNK